MKKVSGLTKFITIIVIITIGGGISEWIGYNVSSIIGLLGYIVTLILVFYAFTDEFYLGNR